MIIRTVKYHKKDILYCILINIYVLFMVFFLIGKDNIFGASIDWGTQHTVIADYFRQYFYKYHQLIPDFIYELGAGENPYNMAYYGLLNPIILISYFMPFVSMTDYIMVASVIEIMLCVILIYIFIKKHIANADIAALATFIFSSAAPLIYHSHKQIMFVNYMPFLLLALIGARQYIYQGRKSLLIISTFLSIMCSFLYAPANILVITIYCVYLWADRHNNMQADRVRIFLKDGLVYIGCMAISVAMSAVLIIPSLFTILETRGESVSNISLTELIIPDLSLNGLIYSAYGIGLGCIAVFALIYMAAQKNNRRLRILSVTVYFIIAVPAIRWLLNGTLYVRAKSLIPFLPLIVLFIAYYIYDLWNGCSKKRIIISCILSSMTVLYGCYTQIYKDAGSVKIELAAIIICIVLCIFCIRRKNAAKVIMSIVLIISSATICYSVNSSIGLLTKKEKNDIYLHSKTVLTDKISELVSCENLPYKTFVRSSMEYGTVWGVNRYYNEDFLSIGIYTSTSNNEYRNLLLKELSVSQPSANGFNINSEENYLLENFLGVRYIITNNKISEAYNYICNENNLVLCENKNALPIGYGTGNVMSLNEYEGLAPQDKLAALQQYIVADVEKEYVYQSPYSKTYITLPFERNADGSYHVSLEEDTTINIENDLSGKVFILHLKIAEAQSNVITISANGIRNRLSSKSSIYPNENYDFYYVLTSYK
ncbi:MAG: YfhO family protein, partial [Eubacterium sp.]